MTSVEQQLQDIATGLEYLQFLQAHDGHWPDHLYTAAECDLKLQFIKVRFPETYNIFMGDTSPTHSYDTAAEWYTEKLKAAEDAFRAEGHTGSVYIDGKGYQAFPVEDALNASEGE
jgi:hypothetical protein